LGLFWY